MKKLLKLGIFMSIVITGLFITTPTLANTNLTSYENGLSGTQAVPADRIYVSQKFKSGVIVDKYFYSHNHNGYQYRGYLSLTKKISGGGLYSGYIYRAPLPYPIY